ncbi:MAG: hypothetical protein KDE09_22275, partial [Anaerolineales bacterium]|nr:hypothetical protein [Anaerolineales bacterium]
IISLEGDSYRLADRKRSAQAANQAKAPSGSEGAQIAPKKAKAPTGSSAENNSSKGSVPA